jgi:D-alanine transaminase
MGATLPIAYLGGEFLPLADARISPMDRSFLFGDGIYEGIAAYDGQVFQMPEHIARLKRSLDELDMPDPLGSDSAWSSMLRELIERNGGGDQSVYVQVSRGAYAGRDHRIPEEQHPMVFAFSAAGVGLPEGIDESGVKAITQADLRWGRCDVKAVALLANVLHRTAADRAGAAECLLVRDGIVIEGSSTSLFMVKDGVVSSKSDGEEILPGVTRGFVIAMIEHAGIEFRWQSSDVETLLAADEVWISSSLRELMPVTEVDGHTIGDGRPGPHWRRVLDLMRTHRDSQLS